MWWLEETVKTFNGLNLSELTTDEAWLNISSFYGTPLWIYVLSDDCHTCSFRKLLDTPIMQNFSYKTIVKTQHNLTFRLRTSGKSNYTPSINDSFRICDLPGKLGEFGVYSLFIGNDSDSASALCSLTTELEPVNIYLPILAVFIFWLFFGLTLKYFKQHGNWYSRVIGQAWDKIFAVIFSNPAQYEAESSLLDEDAQGDGENSSNENVHSGPISDLRKSGKRNTKLKPKEPGTTVPAPERAASSRSVGTTCSLPSDQITPRFRNERLKSLDAFRGLCIIIMIFADDGGGGYYFFQHCTWNGLYVADLAFPWFLWICGVSIPFSMHAKLGSGTGFSKLKLFKEVLARSLKLIFLGIMVNTTSRATAVPLEYIRLPGVLQRFGLCYFMGTSLFLLFYNPGAQESQENLGWKEHFKDFNYLLVPWVSVLACLGLHSAIVHLLPVPGCPTGYLGPGGLHDDSAVPPQCIGGATGYIDRLIFGINHIHNWPTSKKMYESGPFDPEGVLGILTSIFHIWLGVQTGVIVLTYNNAKARLVRFLVWSGACGIFGVILCGGFPNDGWIPVNKNLWSLSFVLVTSSLALVLLAILYFVIDVQMKWNGAPLVHTGRNSIFLYLGHEVCHAMIPWHFTCGRMRIHTIKLMETCWGIMLWIILAVYLYERKLFYVV